MTSKLSRLLLLGSLSLSVPILGVGCAKHADFVNLRQEVRAAVRAQAQAQEKARAQHEALDERLQRLEVALESNETDDRLRGLALRLHRVEDRLSQLEEAQRRQASELAQPPEPLAKLPEVTTPEPGGGAGIGGGPGSVPRGFEESRLRSPEPPAPPPAPPLEEPRGLGGPESFAVTPTSAFNDAYKDYLNGRYDLAIDGFQSFLEDFPSTSLVPNAQYWLGESYSQKRDYVRAIQSFERMVDIAPGHEKVPSALFKIGLAAMEIGDTAKARTYLRRVIEEHAASNEAGLAKNKLADLR